MMKFARKRESQDSELRRWIDEKMPDEGQQRDLGVALQRKHYARSKWRLVAIGAALCIMVAGNGAYMESCAEYGPDPVAQNDPCAPGEVCASGTRRVKYDLPNKYHSYFDSRSVPGGHFAAQVVFEWWGHGTWTDWRYTLGPNIIRTRNTTHDAWVRTPVGEVDITNSHWAYSACGRVSGNDTCVTRRQATAHAQATIKLTWIDIQINYYQTACVATRIYAAIPAGQQANHIRAAYEGTCPEGPAASASVAKLDGGRVVYPKPQIGVGPTPRLRKLAREGLHQRQNVARSRPVGLQDLVTPLERRAISAACWSTPGATASGHCERLIVSLYRSLTPEQKRLVRDTKVTACAGLSPRAWKRLHPESRCAKQAA